MSVAYPSKFALKFRQQTKPNTYIYINGLKYNLGVKIMNTEVPHRQTHTHFSSKYIYIFHHPAKVDLVLAFADF